MQELPRALGAMAPYRQFILYKVVPSRRRPGKFDKLPVDYRSGYVVDAHNPDCWLTGAEAVQWCAQYGGQYGVGFVFTRHDPFFFIDIDQCAEAGQWSEVARDLMGRTRGAAIEVSYSGTGLHIIGSGRVPDHGCKNTALGLELYTEERFVALTGSQAMGDAGVDCSDAMASIVPQYFPVPEGGSGDLEDWRDGPVEEWDGPEDDDELLRRAMASRSAGSAFDRKASFADLFTRNVDVLSECFPDSEREFDESSADAALASHLSFWTGRDHERIARLMWRSELVRDKWEREDYIPRTVTRSVASHSGDVYRQKEAREVEPVEIQDRAAVDTSQAPSMRSGVQFMAAQQQIEHFAGCVYIQQLHKVFTPSGAMLNPQQFRATYGGYEFALDSLNEKSTKNAFEAFTESQAVTWPIAYGLCFRPDEEPGGLIEHEGQRYCNVYVDIQTPRQEGDPTPFLNHLAKLLPNVRDREIILAYMAACVQHKGVKFQWAPLIQGVQGNGKTMITRIVKNAIGQRYSHMPRADQIASQFNGWLLNKIFIGVEDIYVPDSRQEVIEVLKPMITGGDGLEIQYKGVDQVTADVCANFILNSNHKDAIRKTRDDRRFAVFYTAHQSAEDLARDGITGDYFPKLYAWLREGGYAIVAKYLDEYQIPDELNPATYCDRAPVTSSTEDAIEASLGGIEQEIREAIEEDRPGFAGGWVSSMALDRLLANLRAQRQIPPNRRRELLQGLGYDWHPGLKNGRVNNPVPPDNGKTRLFIRDGHVSANLRSPTAIAEAYTKAQMSGDVSVAESVFGENSR